MNLNPYPSPHTPPRYADFYERALLNGIVGNQDRRDPTKGTSYIYMLPLGGAVKKASCLPPPAPSLLSSSRLFLPLSLPPSSLLSPPLPPTTPPLTPGVGQVGLRLPLLLGHALRVLRQAERLHLLRRRRRRRGLRQPVRLRGGAPDVRRAPHTGAYIPLLVVAVVIVVVVCSDDQVG